MISLFRTGVAGFGLALAGTALASETVTYQYDARGRLVRIEHGGGANDGTATDYGYDHADNRTAKTVTNASVPMAMSPLGRLLVIPIPRG